MTKQQAEFLKSVCEQTGADCEIYEGYSGRCMYGKTTVGIVVGSTLKLLQALAEYALNAMREQSDEDLADETAEFKSLRQDNMGLDTIIY